MFNFNNKEKELLEMLDNIESFIDNKTNNIALNDNNKNNLIIDKLNKISNKLNNRNKEEIIIYGEIMLICEKLAKGEIVEKIYHINTNNKKLNYIAKTINHLVDSLNSILGSETKKFLEVLDNYSKMNFTTKIENENAILTNTLNNITDLISNILKENKSNGLTLDETSNILIQNVDVLNVSSNSARVSLEETARALEEITSNIRNNTQNIAKMSVFSNSVTKSAIDGENLANQTVKSMEDINTQVKAINEAISVIDKIAFQTNILSLNRAVEARTAGEAGKGFTVVRQEVRNLASRSAEAAKEIKNIVENATKKANDGKNIANNMITGYKELNNNITNTINLIQDIEMSSKEQLLGIEQINDAVNKLDQQTQQNANVATQTHNVAIVIHDVAKLIVKNADAKEFIGKNEAVSKKFDIAKTDVKPLHNNVNKSKTPVINNNVNKNKTSITNNSNNKVVISSNTSDEEWESF